MSVYVFKATIRKLREGRNNDTTFNLSTGQTMLQIKCC